jgi:ATP-dependent RNA helicase MSS116, mitochondrial
MTHVQAAVLPLLPEIAQPYNSDSPPAGSPRPARDLLVRAKTGTGKTMAFLVPAIEARLNAREAYAKEALANAGLTSDKSLEKRAKYKFSREQVGTLIISPTRELATQIVAEAEKLCSHYDDLEVRLFTGGVSKRAQMRDWMRGRRDIVVATPGRLRDVLTSDPDVARGMAKTKLVSVNLFLINEIFVCRYTDWKLNSSSSTRRTRFSTWVSATT